MSYYQGDFYRAAFPAGRGRGDPGFWSFLGGLAKKAVGFIPGVGPALSAAIPSAAPGGISGIIRTVRPAAARIGGMVVRHPVLSAAGAAGAVGAMGAFAGHEMTMGGGARGFHPCKSRHGCKTGEMVRNRHMRVTNPRALKRALRRVGGFGRLASKVMRLTHPHRRGKMTFRFPKRKK